MGALDRTFDNALDRYRKLRLGQITSDIDSDGFVSVLWLDGDIGGQSKIQLSYPMSNNTDSAPWGVELGHGHGTVGVFGFLSDNHAVLLTTVVSRLTTNTAGYKKTGRIKSGEIRETSKAGASLYMDVTGNQILKTPHSKIEMDTSPDHLMTVTKYKDDGVTVAYTELVDKNGSSVIENNGHQLAMIAASGSEIFKYTNKKTGAIIQVTESGDIVLNVNGSTFAIEMSNGDLSMNHKSGTYVAVEQDAVEVGTQDGSTILLGKDQAQIALSTGQSLVLDNSGDTVEVTAGNVNVDGDIVQLGSNPIQQPLMTSSFITEFNALKLALATHVHTSATPGNPTSPPLPPQLVVFATPTVPIGGDNVTAQVTGG